MGSTVRIAVIVFFILTGIFMGCTNYGYMSAPVSSGVNSATQTAIVNAVQTSIAATMTAVPAP